MELCQACPVKWEGTEMKDSIFTMRPHRYTRGLDFCQFEVEIRYDSTR